MPRPRNLAVVTSGHRRADHDALPPALQTLVDTEDPALACVTTEVLAARMAGEDVTDPDVIARCIANGRIACGITDAA